MQKYFDDMMQWFQEPFQSNGSALNWILFVGLLVIATWLWNTVIVSITD